MTEQDRLLYEAYDDLERTLHKSALSYDSELFTREYVLGWNTCLSLALVEVMNRAIEIQRRYSKEIQVD